MLLLVRHLLLVVRHLFLVAEAPGVLATPKIRGLAKQMGIDLNSVKGTGANGRVLEEDATD